MIVVELFARRIVGACHATAAVDEQQDPIVQFVEHRRQAGIRQWLRLVPARIGEAGPDPRHRKHRVEVTAGRTKLGEGVRVDHDVPLYARM
jgi:hypothetical protein